MMEEANDISFESLGIEDPDNNHIEFHTKIKTQSPHMKEEKKEPKNLRNNQEELFEEKVMNFVKDKCDRLRYYFVEKKEVRVKKEPFQSPSRKIQIINKKVLLEKFPEEKFIENIKEKVYGFKDKCVDFWGKFNNGNPNENSQNRE